MFHEFVRLGFLEAGQNQKHTLNRSSSVSPTSRRDAKTSSSVHKSPCRNVNLLNIVYESSKCEEAENAFRSKSCSQQSGVRKFSSHSKQPQFGPSPREQVSAVSRMSPPVYESHDGAACAKLTNPIRTSDEKVRKSRSYARSSGSASLAGLRSQ